MKTKFLSFLIVLVISCSFSIQKANAQIPVTDGAHIGINTAEWWLNVARWKSQIDEMIDASHIREGLQKSRN